MPSLDQIVADDKINLLQVSESGGGKTGSLASLVDAGFKVRILDFDKGVQPIAGYTKNKANLRNVNVVQLSDRYKPMTPGPMLTAMGIKQANAFSNGMKALDSWPDDLGPIESWGRDCILVIDSLSFMGKAALNSVLLMNGYINKAPETQHWGAAMDSIERVLARLTSDEVTCHVIVNTHVDLRGQEGSAIQRAYPMALGAKLSPKIGTFFNNLVSYKTSGTGKREIKTKTDGLLVCKTSAPTKESYPIETGLADLFRDLGVKFPA